MEATTLDQLTEKLRQRDFLDLQNRPLRLASKLALFFLLVPLGRIPRQTRPQLPPTTLIAMHSVFEFPRFAWVDSKNV